MLSTIDTQANRKAMSNTDFNKWVKPDDLANVILSELRGINDYNRCCDTYFWSNLNISFIQISH